MNKLGFLSILLWGSATIATLAEEPINHTVSFPKTGAWTILFESMGPPAPAKPAAPNAEAAEPAPIAQLKKMVVAENNNLRRDALTWSDGKITERWWVKNPPFVLQDGENGKIHAAKPGNKGSELYDASFFSWVNAETFKGLQNFKGKPCRYYEMEVVLIAEDMELTRRAWIDNVTSQPVAWTESGTLALFHFEGQIPPGELVLPERYQARIKKLMAFLGPTSGKKPGR